MTLGQTRRVAATFDTADHERLTVLAERNGVAVAAFVASIIRSFLLTGQAEVPTLPAPADRHADDPPVGSPPVVASRPPAAAASGTGEPPPWLPPTDAEAFERWAVQRGDAIQSLLDRYPRELADLHSEWVADPLVREQIWAMSYWREQIDDGVYDDPKVELLFAASLGDLRRFLTSRGEEIRREELKAISRG